MWPDIRYAVGLAALVFALPQSASADPTADVAVAEVRERIVDQRLEEADVVYPLAVLDGAGWDAGKVEDAIREVERIFAQCRVTVIAGSVYRIEAVPGYRELDESMQARILDELPPTRPIALLVDRTADSDIAYAYRMSAPTASRGTAWVTRAGNPACLGRSLAHELGHILLDSEHHSGDRDNLMFHSCNISNVAGSRPGTVLTAAQCGVLRER